MAASPGPMQGRFQVHSLQAARVLSSRYSLAHFPPRRGAPQSSRSFHRPLPRPLSLSSQGLPSTLPREDTPHSAPVGPKDAVETASVPSVSTSCKLAGGA